MASLDEVLKVCSSYINHNQWDKEDNKCKNCIKMVNYIKVLLTELKSVQTILKLLFEESTEEDLSNLLKSEVGKVQLLESKKSSGQSVNVRTRSLEESSFKMIESGNQSTSGFIETLHLIPTIVNRFPVRKLKQNDCSQQRKQTVSNLELKSGRNKAKIKKKRKLCYLVIAT
jgi:hypothetical protein